MAKQYALALTYKAGASLEGPLLGIHEVREFEFGDGSAMVEATDADCLDILQIHFLERGAAPETIVTDRGSSGDGNNTDFGVHVEHFRRESTLE